MIRQLVVESLLFSTLAGLLGVALGWAAVSGFRGLSPDIPRIDSVQVDVRILAISLALSTLVGLAAGLVPAFRTGTDSLAAGLRRSSSHVAGRGRRWMDAMVAGQLALALILGVGATLLVRSFLELRAVDPGFAPEGITTFSMGTKRSAEPELHWQAWDALLDEVRQVPGLQGVAAASNLPFESPNWAPGVRLPGAAPDEVMTGNAGYLITPDYLETMGIPIVRGRGFTSADGAGDSPVMLLNETFVRQHLDGADAVGMHLALGEDAPPAEVVGIVGDVVQTRAEEGLRPAVYVPYRQGENWPWARIVVRSDRDPVQLAAELREAGARYASFLPVQNLGTLSQRILGTRSEPRLHTLLLLGFAAVAGLLAAGGVYGTLAYTVGRRRREMGIRMAMGADAARIFGIVLRQSLGVTLGGLAVGLAGAALLGRLLERFLFQVQPLDLPAFASASILLISAALLAGLLPARRATRVDPTVSLRSD
jgi:predicted permease